MVQKCPVCEGRMTVPEGFYEGKPIDADGPREKCRTCFGTGTLGPLDPPPQTWC